MRLFRWFRGLAAFGLLLGLIGASSAVDAQVDPGGIDVAPIWVVVEVSQLIVRPRRRRGLDHSAPSHDAVGIDPFQRIDRDMIRVPRPAGDRVQ